MTVRETPVQDMYQEDPSENSYRRIYQRLDQAISASQPFKQVLDLVLDAALELTGAYYGSLRLVNYREGQLVSKAIRVTPGTLIDPENQRDLPLDGSSVIARVVRDKHPALIDDLTKKAHVLLVGPDFPMLSELAVPMFSHDGKAVVGVLNVESPERDAFSLRHQQCLEELAPRAQMVVQRARLSEAYQTIARKVLEMDPDALLACIVEALADLLQVPVCSIWLLEADTGDLVIKRSVGRESLGDAESQDSRVSKDLVAQTFIGKVFAQKKPDSLLDVRKSPDFHQQELAREQDWRSTLAIPILTASGEALGVISVYSKGEERVFTEDDQSLALAFATHVATALQQNALLEEKQQAAQQLTVINDILTASVSSDDLDTLLRQAALLISHTFNYRVDLCVIEQVQLVFKATALYPGVLQEGVVIRPLSLGIAGAVASSGTAERIPDVSKDTRYVKCSAGTKSELAVPMINHQKQIIGVLNVESDKLDTFTPEHERIFTAVASGITLAMENARRHQEREALHRISTIVSQEQDLDQILDKTTETVLDLLKTTACSLYLVGHDGQYLYRVTHKGLPEAVVTRAQRLQKGESIAGKVWASAAPLVIWDALHDSRTDDKIQEDDHLHSIMAVPVQTTQGILGVLVTLTEDTRYFTQLEVALLDEIGAHIGLAIEKDRAHYQYQRLFQDAQDLIFIVDQRGCILEANAAVVRMSDYEPSELLHMPIAALIAEEGVEPVVQERFLQVSRGELVPPWEFVMRCKDGSAGHSFESNLTPIRDATNTITTIQAIWRDVTARRQRNQQFTALLELTQRAIRPFEQGDLLMQVAQGARALLDSDHCVVHLCEDNATLVESAVWPAPESDSVGNLCPLPFGDGIIGRVAATGDGQMVHEIPREDVASIPRSLGHPPRRLLAMPIKSPEGVAGVISVSRCQDKAARYTVEDQEYLELLANLLSLDLAYRRLAEVQARQQTAITVLEQIDLLGGFLAHKVCGFLGAIGMTADLLHSRIQATDAVTTALLGNLYKHGRVADRLVTQFRNMQKVAGHYTEDVPLEQVVKTAFEHIEVPAHIALHCGSLDELVVHANRDVLSEVIAGVVQNALDVMPSTGTLSLEGGMSHDQSEVWIDLSDTGSGIPPKALDKLFKPFYSTKVDAGGGLGLALWLSRLYLQTLGGDIAVTRTSASGTTFTLRLPVAREGHGVSVAPLTGSKSAETQHTGMPVTAASETPCVLLVEDAAYWQDVLSPALMLHGLQVQMAASAAEATQMLAQHTFDAFVVDVRLDEPDEDNMDGLDVVQHIRAHDPAAPVVILSIWEPSLHEAQARFGNMPGITIVDKNNRVGVTAAFAALARRLSGRLGA